MSEPSRQTLAPTPDADSERIRALVRFCDKVAWWLDDCLRIPGTRFRFGLDAIVGVFPVAGDALGFAVSALTMARAARDGVPRSLLLKMGRNVVIDLIGSIVPVFGDVFDAAFKAHRRNVNLLRSHYAAQLPAEAPRRRAPWFVGALATLAVSALLWSAWRHWH
ncbi:MAG: hypothetical protein JWR16_2630 [Nevskia sp.]|nr:hypothetical protein [Nevskia sp.]